MHDQKKDSDHHYKADLFGLLFYRTINLSSRRGKNPHTAFKPPGEKIKNRTK